MKRLSNFARGLVLISITGRRPERVLNLFSAAGIYFSDLEKKDEITLTLRVYRRDLAAARRIVSRAYCDAEIMAETGAPKLLRRLKKRYALFVMPLVCVFAALIFSLFIWEIEITGNVTVPDAQILSALADQGVRIGSFGLSIDREILRSEVIAAVPKLSWLTVNVKGCRAEVIVREKVDAPELVNSDRGADIIASRTGLISEMNVFAGAPKAQKGDTVLKGEVLISGTLNSLSGKVRRVHALGEVQARTWYEISEKIPLEYISKRYTGETKSKKSIIIGNYRINLYISGRISLDLCDKIIYRHRPSLPGGLLLPFEIVTSEYREYDAVSAALSPEQAESILRERLMQRLRGEINGTATSLEFETENDGEYITVTLRAECLENIAETVYTQDNDGVT